jgi:Uma2 family endonuclease
MDALVLERPITKKTTPIDYPTSDGEPMAETEAHVLAILQLLSALRHFFRKQAVYVVGNIYLYYHEGDPKARKSPDVMVVKNAAKHERRSFKTWEEQAMPSVVFEITSRDTSREDTTSKATLYAALGIREYFLFDPLHEYLDEQFMGYRLVGSEYVAIPTNEDGEIFSTELQAVLRPEGKLLRVVDPQTGLLVPNLEEAVDIAEQEAQRAEQEAQRAEQEAQRAEQEAQRAEQEAQRAEQEAQRANATEAENLQLRAQIEALLKQRS